jgi:hypothetical protein
MYIYNSNILSIGIVLNIIILNIRVPMYKVEKIIGKRENHHKKGKITST